MTEKKLKSRLYKQLFRITARSAMNGDHEEAKKTLRIIWSKYGVCPVFFLLCFAVMIFKYIPLMRGVGRKLKKMRRDIVEKRLTPGNLDNKDRMFIVFLGYP